MRLPNTAHTSRPWRIHELTRDLRLEDVWALPTPGGPDDFPRLVHEAISLDPSQSASGAVRALFAIRWKVGELLGWDGPEGGLGSRVPTLRDRLPADLRDAPSGPDFAALPFTPLYLIDDEFAAEIANRTMHGVLHLAWVPDESGGYRGEMAVYVKRNGVLGAAYMAAIAPFRHRVVYPPMLREIGRIWRARAGERPTVMVTALDGELAVCRLPPDAALPAQLSLGESELLSITRTREELSIVCAASAVPPDATVEAGWRALGVVGPLDFGLTGILASLAEPLAAAGFSIFAISTYDTDYVLVREEKLAAAIEALRAAGHTVTRP